MRGALIKNEKLWRGSSPITLAQMDDFVLWVTIGIIVGGRTGYVLFYNPFLHASIRPRFSNCGKAACPFTAASLAASSR